MRARNFASRKLLVCSSPVEAQLFIQTRAISSYSSVRVGRIVGGGISLSSQKRIFDVTCNRPGLWPRPFGDLYRQTWRGVVREYPPPACRLGPAIVRRRSRGALHAQRPGRETYHFRNFHE